MRHLWLVGLVGLTLLWTAPGCFGCGTPGVSVDPVPAGGTTADHEVRCGCQLGWDNQFIEPDGGVDTTACSCTDTTGCSQTTTGVCQPLDVVSDPPTVRTGLLSFALATPTRLRIDATHSQVSVKAKVQGCLGSACVGFSDTETSAVHGTLTLYGKPCPGGTCSVRLGLVAHPDDVTFYFGCLSGICLGNAKLTAMSVVAGTDGRTVGLQPDGTALIPAGRLEIVADGQRDGNQFKVTTHNQSPVRLRLDYAHRTFSLPGGLNLDLGDGSSGSLTLQGTIANQPPEAVTGPDQTLECTEPGGAHVTLDASGSTDPDDDLVATAWWHDGALTPDAHLATSVGRTRVTVTDTTAPVITDVQVSPPCLWPPNHAMALYELGRDLQVTVDDACDPHPQVRVVSVTSDQPANGGGSGNTPVDVVQGTTAFCVRAERSATLHQDRIYSVVLQAEDASGNRSALRTVQIRVPHDQGEMSAGRCADAGTAPPPGTGGCVAAAGGAAGPGLWLLAILGALVGWRRR